MWHVWRRNDFNVSTSYAFLGLLAIIRDKRIHQEGYEVSAGFTSLLSRKTVERFLGLRLDGPTVMGFCVDGHAPEDKDGGEKLEQLLGCTP